jgi:hypothetical protein
MVGAVCGHPVRALGAATTKEKTQEEPMKSIAAVTLVALLSSNGALAQSSAVTSDCTGAWGRYSGAPGPKAFANGKSQGCGWQIKTGDFPTIQAIRAQALRQCAQYAGPAGGCKIIAQSQ